MKFMVIFWRKSLLFLLLKRKNRPAASSRPVYHKPTEKQTVFHTMCSRLNGCTPPNRVPYFPPARTSPPAPRTPAVPD